MTTRTRGPSRFRRFVPTFAAALILAPVSGAQAERSSAAADTVVVVVSADSPVTEIPRSHLADLYLGRTASFPDGSRAEPIDQDTSSPVRAEFYELFLGRSLTEIKSHWSKLVFTGRGRPPRDVETGEEMRRLVADNPWAVGYMERRLVDGSVRIVRVE